MKSKSKKDQKCNQVFDYKAVRTFEDACRILGIDPSNLPVVTDILEEIQKPIIAYYKLVIIFKAINNGWRPDWGNNNQGKYYPWFWVLSSGFGFSGSGYSWSGTSTYVGSRLCTDTSEKALYIAKQFESEYRDFLLYSE